MWVVNSYVSNYSMYMTHILQTYLLHERCTLCGCKNTCALAQSLAKKAGACKTVYCVYAKKESHTHTHTSVTMSKVCKFV